MIIQFFLLPWSVFYFFFLYMQGFTKLSQTEYVIEDLDKHKKKGERKIKGAKRDFKVFFVFCLPKF